MGESSLFQDGQAYPKTASVNCKKLKEIFYSVSPTSKNEADYFRQLDDHLELELDQIISNYQAEIQDHSTGLISFQEIQKVLDPDSISKLIEVSGDQSSSLIYSEEDKLKVVHKVDSSKGVQLSEFSWLQNLERDFHLLMI